MSDFGKACATGSKKCRCYDEELIPCSEHCSLGGYGAGIVLGTAPLCHAGCDRDCPQGKCEEQHDDFADGGHTCTSGSKVCCCASKTAAPPSPPVKDLTCDSFCKSAGWKRGDMDGTAPACGKCFASPAACTLCRQLRAVLTARDLPCSAKTVAAPSHANSPAHALLSACDSPLRASLSRCIPTPLPGAFLRVIWTLADGQCGSFAKTCTTASQAMKDYGKACLTGSKKCRCYDEELVTCSKHCSLGGYGAGIVLGTAPLCNAGCDRDCPQGKCEEQHDDFADGGHTCTSGSKVCCCASKTAAPPSPPVKDLTCDSFCKSAGWKLGYMDGTAPFCGKPARLLSLRPASRAEAICAGAAPHPAPVHSRACSRDP
jgi:hypothetical protein